VKNTDDRYKVLETISILSLACMILGYLFTNRLFYLACTLLFIGLFAKKLSAKIAHGWLKFATVIGTINSTIILYIIFFFFLTPLAFLYRKSKGDFMNIKNNRLISYWHERNYHYKPEDFENSW
jgi:hypothetical protein